MKKRVLLFPVLSGVLAYSCAPPMRHMSAFEADIRGAVCAVCLSIASILMFTLLWDAGVFK